MGRRGFGATEGNMGERETWVSLKAEPHTSAQFPVLFLSHSALLKRAPSLQRPLPSRGGIHVLDLVFGVVWVLFFSSSCVCGSPFV